VRLPVLRWGARKWALTALAVACALFGGDYLLYPWQFPLPGRGALAGQWLGTMTWPDGVTREVSMEIQRAEEDEEGAVGADVAIRRADGAVENYAAAGAALEYLGGSFTLVAREQSGPERAGAGYRLGFLDGRWEGDRIAFSVFFNHFDAEGKVSKGRWAGGEWGERNQYPPADTAFALQMRRAP
jgi:hypothetical protein